MHRRDRVVAKVRICLAHLPAWDERYDDPGLYRLESPGAGVCVAEQKTGWLIANGVWVLPARLRGTPESWVNGEAVGSGEWMAVWALRLPPEPLEAADLTRLAGDVAEPGRQHCAAGLLGQGVRRHRRRFNGVVARRVDGLLAHEGDGTQHPARAPAVGGH